MGQPRVTGTAQAELTVAVGAPGSGKSTWRRDWVAANADATVVCLDDNRAAVSCCRADQAATARAVEMGVATARQALARGDRVVWDATNAEASSRRLLLVLAAEYDAATTAVVLLPDLATVLARNAGRSTTRCAVCGYAERVPDAVVAAMHQAITADLLGLPAEGWHAVTVAHA